MKGSEMDLIEQEEEKGGLAKLDFRTSVLALEEQMLKLEQLEFQTSHYFSEGVYVRELFIPKGMLLTGKIHKHEHINIISQGKIMVATENGEKLIEAPATFKSAPGIKRVGFALEDTTWSTIHVTEETDLDKLEEEFVTRTYEEYDSWNEGRLLEGDV